MKISVSRQDAIWGYIGTFLSMCSNLIILPFILNYLDDNMVGLYYVFVTLSAIAILFDFGFTPSIARSVAYAWSGAENLKKSGAEKSKSAEPNYILLLRVIKTCKIIYSGLALVALVIAISLGTYYIKNITEGIEGISHYVAWVIYAFAIALNLLYGYYLVLLRGVGNVKDSNRAVVVAKCLQIFLCIFLLAIGSGIIGVAVSYLLYGLVFRLLAKRYFFTYKGMKNSLEKVTLDKSEYKIKEVFNEIWPNTWREGLVTLSEYLLNQATTVIASLYLSLYETGLYSLSVQLVTAIASIAMALYTTYQPALQSAYVNRDTDTQRKNMSLVLFVYVIIFMLGMIGLVIIGRPLVHWIKPSYELSITVLIVVGLYQFILKYRNCFTSYISSTNRLIYTRAFVVSAVICVLLSLLFTGFMKWGIYGLLFAQLLSQVVYNAWKWPVMVHQELQMTPLYVLRTGFSETKKLVWLQKDKILNFRH